jgi:type IV secretory pathway TraG/TraD family ATPase VirD4
MIVSNFPDAQANQLSQDPTRLGVIAPPDGRYGGGPVTPTTEAHTDAAETSGTLPVAFGGPRVKASALGLLVPAQDWQVAGLPAWLVGIATAASLIYIASQLPPGTFGGRHIPWVTRGVRVKAKRHPGPGFAGRWTLWKHYGKQPARKVAKHGRPSMTWQDRLFGPSSDYATFHGKAQGWIHRWGVYSTFEQIVLVIAPPQEGKSLKAAASIVRAPGPVVVTSIRGDLIKLTAVQRQQVGYLWCWNPEQVGHYASNFRWNPAAGCEDILAAQRRANFLVRSSTADGLSEGGFWLDQAAMLLTALLHAAGLVGANMGDIHEWILTRSDEPLDILEQHPHAHPQGRLIVDEWRHHMDEKTAKGVTATLSRTFMFMLNPNVVEMLSPPLGERTFDFGSFVESRDTLYLVSSGEEHGSAGPLFAAFLGELAEFARLYGSKSVVDGRQVSRLDPPLTMELDEIANIAYVPVNSWASWAGGSGIRIHVYLQTWAAAMERWGVYGSEALWGNSKIKIIYSGITEGKLLEKVNTLVGTVRLRERGGSDDRNGQGRDRPRYVDWDIISVSGASMTPKGYALVLGSGVKPTVVKVASVLHDKEFKAASKALSKGQVQISLGPVRERSLPPLMPELRGRLPEPQQRPEIAQVDQLAERRRRQEAPPLSGQQTVPPSFPPGEPPAGSPAGTGPRSAGMPSWYQPADQEPEQQWTETYGPGNLPQPPSEEELRALGWWNQDGEPNR